MDTMPVPLRETERHVDDGRIGANSDRLAILETEFAHLATREELQNALNAIRGEIHELGHRVGHVIDSQAGFRTVLDRLSLVNEQNMVKTGEQAQERHQAEIAALRQQLEDSKFSSRLKQGAAVAGACMGLVGFLALIMEGIKWIATH